MNGGVGVDSEVHVMNDGAGVEFQNDGAGVEPTLDSTNTIDAIYDGVGVDEP